MSEVGMVPPPAAAAAAAVVPLPDAPPWALYVGLGVVAVLVLVVAMMWYRVQQMEQRNAELQTYLEAVHTKFGHTPDEPADV